MSFWIKSPIKASENKIDDPWEKMSDEQVDEAYTKVLSEQHSNQKNITEMISTQDRKIKITKIKSQMIKPRGQIVAVLINNIRSNPNKEHVRNFRATLQTADEKWFQDFFNSNGLQVIMDLITEKYNNPMFTINDMEILGECILCYKALMNNYFRLQNVVTYPGAVLCLIQTLQIPRNLKKVNIEDGEGRKMWGQYYENSSIVLEIMASLCLVPQYSGSSGLKYVMEAAESYKQQNDERVVFEMVLIQLRNQSTPELFLCRILQLINTIIVKHDLLSQRLKLREDWDENIQLNTMIQMLSGKDIGFEERQRLRNLQVKPKISIPETPEEQLRKHVWIYIDEMKQDNEESGMFENNSSEFNPENIFNNMMKRFKGTKALFHLNNIGVSLQQLKPDDDKWLVIDHLIERAVNSTVGDNQAVQTHQHLPKNSSDNLKQRQLTLKPS